VRIRKQFGKICLVFQERMGIDPKVVAYNKLDALLESLYQMQGLKNVNVPPMIRMLLGILTMVYTRVIFPILISYSFVGGLDVRAVRGELLANEKWPTAVFIPVFFVSTFSVLFYFNFLYYMQLELRDSFLNRVSRNCCNCLYSVDCTGFAVLIAQTSGCEKPSSCHFSKTCTCLRTR